MNRLKGILARFRGPPRDFYTMTWKLRGGGKSNKKKRTQKKYKSASFSKLVKQAQFYIQLNFKAPLSFTLIPGPCSGKNLLTTLVICKQIHTATWNLFSADATIFLDILKKKMSTRSWKNQPQMLVRNTQFFSSLLLAWAAQMTQTEEFIFQNMAYRPTVYKTWHPRCA